MICVSIVHQAFHLWSVASAGRPCGERMAVLQQLTLLLWKNYTLQVGPGLEEEWPRHSAMQGPGVPSREEHVINTVVLSLLEAEGSSDSPGTLSALTVFWDPDLASFEDPVRKCAQCHGLPWSVHPGAAPVFHLPSARGHLGARLHPFPQ